MEKYGHKTKRRSVKTGRGRKLGREESQEKTEVRIHSANNKGPRMRHICANEPKSG